MNLTVIISIISMLCFQVDFSSGQWGGYGYGWGAPWGYGFGGGYNRFNRVQEPSSQPSQYGRMARPRH